jgi:hypothetical protein
MATDVFVFFIPVIEAAMIKPTLDRAAEKL